MVDKVSYVQGLAQHLVIIHQPHVSTASEQGVGCLEGHIGLPACSQYLVSLGLAWAERGMGALGIYNVYLVYGELCHLVQYTIPAPLSCRSLVAFNL